MVFRNEISNSKDPLKKRLELVQDYKNKFSNPYIAVSKGYIDEVIEPRETRDRLITGLMYLQKERRKTHEKTRQHPNLTNFLNLSRS